MSQTRREVNSGKEQKDTEIDIYPWIEGIIIKTPPKGIDIGFKVPIRKGKNYYHSRIFQGDEGTS